MDVRHTDSIYESAVGDAEEMARAIRVCLMGSDACLPLTCDVAAGDESGFTAAWADWQSTTFRNLMAPHLVRVFLAAQKHDVQAIIALDRALDTALHAEVADRSAVAGNQFHASLEGARHVKVLDKLRRAVMQQEIRGHHATFFACEAALFNVPLMHLLPAFLFAEWMSARVTSGFSRESSGLQAFESVCAATLRQAGELMSQVAGSQRTISVCA